MAVITRKSQQAYNWTYQSLCRAIEKLEAVVSELQTRPSACEQRWFDVAAAGCDLARVEVQLNRLTASDLVVLPALSRARKHIEAACDEVEWAVEALAAFEAEAGIQLTQRIIVEAQAALRVLRQDSPIRYQEPVVKPWLWPKPLS